MKKNEKQKRNRSEHERWSKIVDDYQDIETTGLLGKCPGCSIM